ncbi:DUF192 domain-containing protein [Candidatus Aenigmatarchaeota archaeon]
MISKNSDMGKITTPIAVIIVIIFAVIVVNYPGLINNDIVTVNESDNPTICFNDNSDCFRIELATTSEQMSQGLMYRKSLDPDKGMLFIFGQEGIYPFWMKNTLIPLDIIWIDEDMTVVYIKGNAQPCGPLPCPYITPDHDARYVLEINGGLADQIGLEVGDKTIINYL